MDTNRDFPYSRKDTKCLRSTSAKIINSIMKNNIVQLLITFHGGMVAIAYEWGSLNHAPPKDNCPDNRIHFSLGEEMGTFAGSFIVPSSHRREITSISDSSSSNGEESEIDYQTSSSKRYLREVDGYAYPVGRMNTLVYGVDGGMEVSTI